MGLMSEKVRRDGLSEGKREVKIFSLSFVLVEFNK